MSNSLWPYRPQPARPLCPWNSPGKNTGVGCHCLLQGIYLIQGSNLCLLHLLHWQKGSLPLDHLGSLYWSRLSPKSSGHDLIGGGGLRQTRRGGEAMWWQQRLRVAATSQGLLTPLAAGRDEEDFLPKESGGLMAYQHLSSRLLASRAVQEYISLVFKPPSLW